LTRSGYRKKEEDESSEADDLDYQKSTTPPSSSVPSNLAIIPPIPTFEELHRTFPNVGCSTPDKKSRISSSPLLRPPQPPSPTNYASHYSPTYKKTSPNMSAIPGRTSSMDDSMIPALDLGSSALRYLDLNTDTNLSTVFQSLRQPSSPLHSLRQSSPVPPRISPDQPHHGPTPPSTSSDDESGDNEIDPIIELTNKKENLDDLNEQTEVPTVTSLLYTISEEPTPKRTPGSSMNNKKTFFSQS